MPTNAIANSSPIVIKEALKKISKNQFTNNRIIGPRNTFLKDTVRKIDILAAHTSKDKNDITQYIAASVISHCFDGWNFLSRGVESIINGDKYSAIHFIYYAELRAVMSIMANRGIGVFDKKHIYFDSNKDLFVFPHNRIGTHQVAIRLIDAWKNSSTPTYKDEILKLILVNNRSLFEWLSAPSIATAGTHSTSIVDEWLQKWSLDLDLQKDQKIRNESSYRPHFNFSRTDTHSLLSNLNSIWSILEPSQSNRFNKLDLYLFRLGMEKMFEKVHGLPISHRKYEIYINSIFNDLGETQSQQLYDFTLRKLNNDDPFIIKEARKDHIDRNINQTNPFPMICRAILLLRLATGFAGNTINDSNVRKDLLKFWWEDIAYKLGMIDSIPSSISTNDLYTDIQDAMYEINTNLTEINSVSDCITKFASETSNLKQFQRTCFWGLGL